MIRYLIKNNFKLMFRNTWSIAVMLLGPVLVIAVLTSAFSELMKSYEGVDEFKVGYRASEVDAVMIEAIKTAGEDSGIVFQEYPEGKIKNVVENNNLAGFVDFSKDRYTVYKSEDYEVEGVTLEYFMTKAMSGNVGSLSQSQIKLPVEKIDYMPAINSVDYYGIIYIAYFSWCGMICATGVLSNEKKYGIVRRFQVSAMTESQNFLGKYIPIVFTVFAGMGIATLVTVFLYDIHWGNPLLSVVIVFLMIAASTALGMMIYNISDNLVITIILQFSIVWILGFIGGSFETYMFQNISESIKLLSPVYHGNRALVELSCMGKSDFVVSAMVYSLVITVVCSVVAVFSGYIRKRGRA